VKRLPPRRETVDELLEQLVLDERAGPALPLDHEQMLGLARRARERGAPTASGKLLRFRKLPLIAVSVVVATSAAAAAVGGFPQLLALVTQTEAPAEVRAGSAQKVHPSAQDPTSTRATMATAPAAMTPPESAPLASGSPATEPAVLARSSAPEPHAPARAGAARTPVRARRSSAAVAPELALDKVTAPDSAPAADLLGVANRARAERRFAAAVDAYRRVIASFPDTRQAQIAGVSAGDLELELGDARAAEQLFYGPVRAAEVGAEALFGLAEAYRAQGRASEERRALALFAQRYPANPLAAAARRRLSELDPAHAPQ